MSVRQNMIEEDIEMCIYELLDEMTEGSAPWTRWTAKLGYPEEDVLKNLSTPVIYTETPRFIDEVKQQGGLGIGKYQMYMGAWDDRKTGGKKEINIISSRILNLFRNPQTVHTTTFTVILGATTYTDTDLMTMKIRIEGIQDLGEKATVDTKEFRQEYRLFIRA